MRFIDTALRDRADLPWMVLALARPEVYEVFPKLWAERQNVQEIRLKELGRKAGERLVRQVLGDSVGPETMERLVKQANGNAFYLEELIRAVAEGKDRVLPETVLAMVETRLARLSLEARRVLRAASVFGEVCWESAVTVLLGGAMSGTMVGDWLSKLVEQEVLAARPTSRFAGEQEFTFRHALLREGAYATLTEEDKRLGHRLAGEWLEQHGEGDPMVLAGHFERGGEGARAASLLPARVRAGLSRPRSGRRHGAHRPRARLRTAPGAPDRPARDALRSLEPGPEACSAPDGGRRGAHALGAARLRPWAQGLPHIFEGYDGIRQHRRSAWRRSRCSRRSIPPPRRWGRWRSSSSPGSASSTLLGRIRREPRSRSGSPGLVRSTGERELIDSRSGGMPSSA